MRQVSAEYRAPFLAHAAMEPVNCTAQVKNGKVMLWASTQAPGIAVDVAAKVAGVDAKDVSIEVLLLGGGFGRRLEVDMVAQAVAIALQCDGAPVQLVWTREQDTQHDMYRPAALARFAARLDEHGHIASWDNKSVSAPSRINTCSAHFGLPGAGRQDDGRRRIRQPYEIANQRIAHVIADSAVPVGYWRSVGHSHNAFSRKALSTNWRMRQGRTVSPTAVPCWCGIRALGRARCGPSPGRAPSAGHAHGVALPHRSAASSRKWRRYRWKTEKFACTRRVRHRLRHCRQSEHHRPADGIGRAVRLSAALGGEITFKEGESSRATSRLPRAAYGQTPEVETIIIASAEHPEGVGEPGTPPIAPAVANAVFSLTGKRLRSLPLRLA